MLRAKSLIIKECYLTKILRRGEEEKRRKAISYSSPFYRPDYKQSNKVNNQPPQLFCRKDFLPQAEELKHSGSSYLLFISGYIDYIINSRRDLSLICLKNFILILDSLIFISLYEKKALIAVLQDNFQVFFSCVININYRLLKIVEGSSRNKGV